MVPEDQVSKPVEKPADAARPALPEDDVLSRETLLELFDHDADLLGELAGLFLADGPALLQDIQAGVSARDPEKVDRAAHTLKGSLGNFGVKRACELCRRLEAMGRNKDLGGAPETLASLEKEMARVTGFMAEIAKEQPR